MQCLVDETKLSLKDIKRIINKKANVYFSAEEAVDLGIVNSLHAQDELLPAAQEIARNLPHGSQLAIAQAKKLINRSLDSSQMEMLEAEVEAQPPCRDSDFHAEAVHRFANKEPRLYDWDAMMRTSKAAE